MANKSSRLLPESYWQSRLGSLAVDNGWLYFHELSSRRPAPNVTAGLPDCIFVRDNELLFVEIKGWLNNGTQRNKLSPKQRVWKDRLDNIAKQTHNIVQYYCWTFPDDWEAAKTIIERA